MLSALINPHGLGLARAKETQGFVEADGLAIGAQHLLVKASVPFEQGSHHFFSDALVLKRGVHEQVRKVHNQMPVGNGVANANQFPRPARRDQAVRVAQGCQQFVGLFGGWPLVGL